MLLTYLGKPTIALFRTTITLIEGQNIKVPCCAIGPPDPEIHWLQSTKRLVSGPSDPENQWLQDTKLLVSNENSSTCVNFSLPNETAVYFCVARNVFGVAIRNLTVIYLSAPQFVMQPRGLLTASISSNVSLHCQAKGSPKPKITWTTPCGAKPDHMKILDNGTLLLWGVSAWDTGLYKCSVTNVAGQSSAMVHLIVPSSKV